MSLNQTLRNSRLLASVAGLVGGLATKRDIRRRLDAFAGLLASGPYRVHSTLAARCSSTDEDEPAVRREFLGARMPHDRTGRLVSALPPRWVNVTTGSGGEGDHDVLLSRAYCTLLLRRDGRAVIRLYHAPEIPERLVEHSRRLRTGLNVPPIEPFTTGIDGVHAVSEPLYEGRVLNRVAPAVQIAAYRRLLEQCARQAEKAEGRFDSALTPETVRDWAIPQWLRAALDEADSDIRRILAGAPVVFSHGDCHANNILVLDTGEIMLIDLERAQPLPFFFDALWVLCGWQPTARHLRQRYLAGDFDEDLAAVWRAAGVQFEPGLKATYLLFMALAHGARIQYRDKPARRLRKVINTAAAVRTG